MDSAFWSYLKEAVGEENTEKVRDALSGPASVSVRLNPNKISEPAQDALARIFSVAPDPVSWSPYGFYLPERPQFTLDPALHAGCYYVQDSSAMYVGHAFRRSLRSMLLSRSVSPENPLRVLDLCAAPGGKTTDLAASLRAECGDSFVLVANEIMKQRATVLADNVGIWGDPSVVVTSADPGAFAELSGYFDIIVADVPCSGEGMFRKDEEAVAQWSSDNVALCQSRQRRIIADVWPALAQNGILVYSTCTFNKCENDQNVEWIAKELGAEVIMPDDDLFPGLFRTQYGISLLPGLVRGEGQYSSALTKTESTPQAKISGRAAKKRGPAGSVPAELRARVEPWFDRPVRLAAKGDMIVAMTPVVAAEMEALDYLHPLLRGTAVGQLKGKDIVPDADLALSIMLKRGAFPEVELSKDKALAFLHKDAITLPEADRGIVLLTYGGHPLGFVKNLGNRCNSLHPQNRRIRMDINNA